MWFWSLFGCDGCAVGPNVGDYLVNVEQAENQPAVAIVTWTTGSAGTGWVSFGPDENLGFETAQESEATTDHRIVVAGIPGASTWHIVAKTLVDGTELASADTAFVSGALPGSLPNFDVSGLRENAGWILTTVFSNLPNAVILDGNGSYSWSFSGVHEEVYTRARLSLDGSSVLFNRFAEDRGIDISSIYRVSLEGSTLDIIDTPNGHHDFVELPEGGYAYLAIDVRDFEGRTIVGDSVVEIDADGGNSRVVWNSWDQWTPPAEEMSTGFYPQGEDWLHCNTIEYDSDARTYLVSSHNLSAVFNIDRDSGELLWQLGGDESSFELTVGTAFERQHAPAFFGDDLFVFDNRDGGDRSYARAYHLDETSWTYAENWTYEGPKGNQVTVLGDIRRYDNGSTLLAWGTAGFLNELDAGGEQVWRADVEFGNVLGFFDPLDGIGGPAAP